MSFLTRIAGKFRARWLSQPVWILVFALLSLLPFSQKISAKTLNVGKAYQEALQEYKKGKSAAALKSLAKIQKKYPGFKPAQALSGKIYYQMGKMERAAKFFKRAGAESIVPDNAFAYGASMFETSNYKEAVKGFREVPKSSKERAYADFYSGIAQFRMGRLDLASSQLRRAKDKDLPPNFRTAKRKLLKTVDQKRLAERQGGAISGSGPYVYVPPPPAPASPMTAQPDPKAAAASGGTAASTAGASDKKDDKKAEEKKPEPAAPKAGITYNVTPSLTHRIESRSDSGPQTENKSESQKTTVNVSGVVNYMFESTMGDQPLVGITIGAKVANKTGNSTSTKLFAYDDDPQNILTSETQLKNSGKTQELSAVPNASTNITEHISVDVKYTYHESVPDGDNGLKATDTSPLAQIDAKIGDALTATFIGSTYTIKHAEKPGQETDTRYNLTLATTVETFTIKGIYENVDADAPEYGNLDFYKSKNFIELNVTGSINDISGTIAVNQATNTPPPDKQIEGPASKLTISGNVTIPFSFGASLQLRASQTKYKDVVSASLDSGTTDKDNKPVLEVGSAQKDEQAMGATFKIAPVDWAYLSLGVDQSTINVTADKAEQQPEFDKSSSTDSLSTFIEIGFSKTF